MNKTLYISDLDGTLLTSGQFVSRKSFETLNKLSERGLLFTYATARSLITASKVTAGLDVKIPVIVYNGAFIMDGGERLVKNVFSTDEAENIFHSLSEYGIDPLVYSVIDGEEKFSYIPQRLTRSMRDFLDTRKGDSRHRPLSGEIGMLDGEPFYFACMDDAGSMSEAYEELKNRYYCVYSNDIYSGDQWLEIMPKTATKANAAVQLKELLGCDRLVVFGDGVNDIPLFEASDECCAVSNAAPELKEIADAIIGSNNEDSIAEYISLHFKAEI
ncbi:MAG: HAD family hydrolase [Oscillospiraceae bacterium]|nr:HAD family hydrolase [Oscillospiraceae bacterium]